MMPTGHAEVPSLYRYSFGNVEFDEARGELRVAGLVVEVEHRPLQVLATLLRHADEVVTRQELFDTVWGARPTVHNVLANAVAKLRKALGSSEGQCIVNVPRVGYRLQGPVTRTASGRRLFSRLDLAPGEPVPSRENFVFDRQLGPTMGNEVWLARHGKTGEPRVYKFSTDGEGLAALKREATLYRVLHDSLGERDDIIRVLDWNFDQPPFYLECEYGGCNLADWAAEPPGLEALPLEQGVQLFLKIADAVAAAHSVGVLHKDLKPANVLVSRDGQRWQLRLADFGSGRLLDPLRLDRLGITAMGLTVTQALSDDSSGTMLYMAPELLSGAAPTVRSDIYALGLMLFQLVRGDLRQLLAPGWEHGVEDELLREDIAAATDGSPERRLGSVDELCERLRGRASRRVESDRLFAAEERAHHAERRLARSRARRPWATAALVMLLAGLGASIWQFERANAARDEAQREAAIATATNEFLNQDLLGAGIGGSSPAWYEKNPRLSEILDAAALRLNDRYRKAPLLAAGLHQTLGRAYRSVGKYAKAAVQLQEAASLLREQLGEGAERSLLADYELAVMQAHLSHYPQATALLQRADAAAGLRRQSMTEIALRSHAARADLLYQQMKFQPALENYRAAQTLQKVLHPNDALMAAHMLLSIAGCELRLQRSDDAEKTVRVVLSGPPYTQARIGASMLAWANMLLGNALRVQGHYAEAIVRTQQAVKYYQGAEGPAGQGTLSALSGLGYLYSLSGDVTRSLQTQREVYQLSLNRWGPGNQYTLVELLNLASDESDSGDFKQALVDLRQAEAGLTAVGGKGSPSVQAARVQRAETLSEMGRNDEALGLIEEVDPHAYQATTSDPGRAAVLKAMRARILLRMGHRDDGQVQMRAALKEMQLAGVSVQEMDPFRQTLEAGQ